MSDRSVESDDFARGLKDILDEVALELGSLGFLVDRMPYEEDLA